MIVQQVRIGGNPSAKKLESSGRDEHNAPSHDRPSIKF